MKIGIAVSTYANEKTDEARIDIIKQCLDSMLGLDIDVIIVNDASVNESHVSLINSYPEFTVINRPRNGGIAKCKNTAIKHFEENEYDIAFLIDDDVEILDKKFYERYIEAYEKTGIHHLCLQCSGDHPHSNDIEINGFHVMKSNHTNGCFLMLTQKMIKELGYFKILPHKYGHEHSNYTMRALLNGFASGFIDVVNSGELLRLIPQSTDVHSGIRTSGKEFHENEREAFDNLSNEKYISYK